jgi:geranylgeranyl diphosphate synthase type I
MTREAREQAVTEAVAERRALVNAAYPEELPVRRPERLYEATRYILDAGGKRLRPAMLLLVAEALTDTDPLSVDYRQFPDVDGVERDIMAAAVSIEAIQSFTLIHDDIMDDDDLRRGVPAVHREYGEAAAILAGDTLYSKAFEIMLETDAEPENVVNAMAVLSKTCTQICEGQSLDVDFEGRTDVTVDEYMEMIRHKTAVLYAAAAAIPTHLLGADDETVEALYAFGTEVGQAFQIKDDLLDVTTPSEKLGKQRGSDLVENKQTILTIHARQQGVDIAGLIDTDDPEAVTEAEIDRAVERLEESGSIAFARERADALVESGIENLHSLPDNEARDRLEDLARYLVERDY